MFSYNEHLDNLLRHLSKVRENTELLGKRLIAQGRPEFGRMLIARGILHDNSKFYGIEWDYLHAGNDVPKEVLDLAIKQHQATNPPHPEYWGGIHNMPELPLAEMVCDQYARSQEFGTNLREWIEKTGVPKYGLKRGSKQYKWIREFVDILLQDSFVRK
jgi:hypothetical protein